MAATVGAAPGQFTYACRQASRQTGRHAGTHACSRAFSRCRRLRPTTRVDRGSVAGAMRAMHRGGRPRRAIGDDGGGATLGWVPRLGHSAPRGRSFIARTVPKRRCETTAARWRTAVHTRPRRCWSSHDALSTDSAAHCCQRGGHELWPAWIMAAPSRDVPSGPAGPPDNYDWRCFSIFLQITINHVPVEWRFRRSARIFRSELRRAIYYKTITHLVEIKKR